MRNFRSKMSVFLYPFTCLPAFILATVMTDTTKFTKHSTAETISKE